MNKIRIIIFGISLILLGWIFTINLNHIDFAKIKNDANYRESISKVENSNNIEELKHYTLKQIEYSKKSREIDSENGILKFWLIIALTFLIITLFVLPKKLNTK